MKLKKVAIILVVTILIHASLTVVSMAIDPHPWNMEPTIKMKVE